MAGNRNGAHGVVVTRLYGCRETDARAWAKLESRIPEDQHRRSHFQVSSRGWNGDSIGFMIVRRVIRIQQVLV